VGSIPITRSIDADVWVESTAGLLKGAHVAQSVEHVLGKDEVTGSIPVVGSMTEKYFI
jgi:hypothetical protein